MYMQSAKLRDGNYALKYCLIFYTLQERRKSVDFPTDFTHTGHSSHNCFVCS